MSIFDTVIDRYRTDSVKWDLTQQFFGHHDVLPMWVADMDFEPPAEVVQAIKERANHGIFGYTAASPAVADAIAHWLFKRHQWTIDTSWILYCNGVVNAISTSIQAFTEGGDKVLINTPVYTPFFEMIEKNGRTAVHSPLRRTDKGYEIDFTHLEECLKGGVRLYIFCSPHNPVGRVWTKEELLRVGELCQKYDCLLISDEIHCDIVYNGSKHIPISSLNSDLLECVITLAAPSKTFNLAGLQASFVLIANEKRRQQFDEALKAQGFFTLNVFGITAMQAAYNHGENWLDELNRYLEGNIKFAEQYLKQHIPEILFDNPEGTYLLWLDCRATGLSEHELKERLLVKGKLALEEGSKYGPGGEGYMRMNIACPRSILEDGLERFRRALG